MTVNVEELNTFGGIAGIRPGWLALRQAVGEANVYTHPDWISAWQHIPTTGTPIILTARDGADLVGVAVLQIRKVRYHGIPLRSIEFIGDSPLNGFLVGAGREEEVVRAFVDRLCGEGRAWDVVELSRMEQGSHTAGLIREGLEAYGLRIYEDGDCDDGICVVDDWDSFIERRSRKFRSDIRLRENRSKKLGTLSIRRYSGLEDRYGEADSLEKLETLLRDAISCSGKSWQGTSAEGTAISDEPAYPFFREIIHSFAALGMLMFEVMYAEDRPIAFDLSFLEGRSIMDYKTGFDPDFRYYGPGAQLLKSLLQYGSANGFHQIDLMSIEKGQEYKRRYVDEIRETRRITVFNRTLNGRLARLLMKGIVPRVKRMVGR
jgi:hypothetical protein